MWTWCGRHIREPIGLTLSVPIIATGIDRHAGLQRHPGHAGLALVQPAVRRPGALRVDAEQLALAEQPDRRCPARPARRTRSPGRPAPGPTPVKNDLLQPPDEARLGEVLALREERDPARHQQRQAGTSRRPRGGCWRGSRHRAPGCARAPSIVGRAQQAHQRAEQHVLRPPVQHRNSGLLTSTSTSLETLFPPSQRVHTPPTACARVPDRRCHPRRLRGGDDVSR